MKLFSSLLFVGLSLIYLPCCYGKQIPPEEIEDQLTKSAKRLLNDLINETKDTRVPIPDAASVTDARNLIREAFFEEYHPEKPFNHSDLDSRGLYHRDPKAHERMIDKLFLAYSEEANPARGYALLIEAKELALRDNNFGLAMKVIDAGSSRYQQDATQTRTECLANAFRFDRSEELFNLAMETAIRGVGHNSFASAKNAAALALKSAESFLAAKKVDLEKLREGLDKAEHEIKNADAYTRKKLQKQMGLAVKEFQAAVELQTKHNQRLRQAKEVAEAISRREKLHHEYTLALQALQVNSNDKRANAVVGRYVCLTLGDWRRGLPFMALGDHNDLAKFARKEVTLRGDRTEIDRSACDPKDGFALANEIWEAAASLANQVPPDSNGKIQADALRRHAAEIYTQTSLSLPNVLDRELAKKRGQFSTGAADEQRFRLAERTPSLRSTNLLLRCEPGKHALTGVWQFVRDGIRSDNAEPAKMKVPFKGDLPEEYDFEIDFTPLGGHLCVAQALSAFGTGFSCDFGGYYNTIVAFQLVDGKPGDSNDSTTRQRMWLTAGRRHRAVIEVRRDSVSARLDGLLVVTMPTDYRNLKHRKDWTFPNDSIGIGSWATPTVFHRASVVPR